MSHKEIFWMGSAYIESVLCLCVNMDMDKNRDKITRTVVRIKQFRIQQKQTEHRLKRAQLKRHWYLYSFLLSPAHCIFIKMFYSREILLVFFKRGHFRKISYFCLSFLISYRPGLLVKNVYFQANKCRRGFLKYYQTFLDKYLS